MGTECELLDSKRLRGQFFTTTNPFANHAFVSWFKSIPLDERGVAHPILEPFAGANNIVWMIRDLGYRNAWRSFDIDPPDPDAWTVSEFPVERRDCISDFPSGFKVAITNPPYLAKNSASRRGLEFHGGSHDDLYKKCLEVMLANCDHVAAIVPESFITQRLFHERLSAIVSLPCRMFDDTEAPVCMALFGPRRAKVQPDFEIWSANRRIGTYEDLSAHVLPPARSWPWEFNSPNGKIGLLGVDGTKKASVKFVPGANIPSADVKSTSRSITRIALPGLDDARARLIIAEANRALGERRAATKDVFMSPFKGLRDDGKYRRRLDFSQARGLLDLACCNLGMDLGALP